jgi:hypothetical protein
VKTPQLRNPTALPLSKLLPQASLFAHQSRKHGVEHVARVMILGLLLTELTGHRDRALSLWAAVFVHDLARTGDGVCYRHGPDAAKLLDTSETVRDRLFAAGILPVDLEAVAAAVSVHSHGELPPDHPHHVLAALLKDADGLDRVRLGDLDPTYLRFPESRTLIPLAEALLKATAPAPPFPTLWSQAEALLKKQHRESF